MCLESWRTQGEHRWSRGVPSPPPSFSFPEGTAGLSSLHLGVCHRWTLSCPAWRVTLGDREVLRGSQGHQASMSWGTVALKHLVL